MFVVFRYYYYLCHQIKPDLTRMQVNLHIITLFYTLYNKGVNSVASICGLQKHEEKNEKKIAKYLVVPNICILSLNAGVNKTLHFFVRAREACRANYSKQRTLMSFLCSFFVPCRLQLKREISTILSRKNIINIYEVYATV